MDLSIFKYKDYFKTDDLDIKESIKVDGFSYAFQCLRKNHKNKEFKKELLIFMISCILEIEYAGDGFERMRYIVEVIEILDMLTLEYRNYLSKEEASNLFEKLFNKVTLDPNAKDNILDLYVDKLTLRGNVNEELESNANEYFLYMMDVFTKNIIIKIVNDAKNGNFDYIYDLLYGLQHKDLLAINDSYIQSVIYVINFYYFYLCNCYAIEGNQTYKKKIKNCIYDNSDLLFYRSYFRKFNNRASNDLASFLYLIGLTFNSCFEDVDLYKTRIVSSPYEDAVLWFITIFLCKEEITQDKCSELLNPFKVNSEKLNKILNKIYTDYFKEKARFEPSSFMENVLFFNVQENNIENYFSLEKIDIVREYLECVLEIIKIADELN